MPASSAAPSPCHSRGQCRLSDLELRAIPAILCDENPVLARDAAERFGFAAASTDWRETVDRCDAVVIAVPSAFHAGIAGRAIAAGKPFLCEKPVGLSAAEAGDLAAAAARAMVPHAVGFTYLRAPMVALARELVLSGRLGRILHFSGGTTRIILPPRPVLHLAAGCRPGRPQRRAG